MDINDFVKQNAPGMKKSRLAPFANEMRRLKDLGYTDLQVRDWLAENGVEVSREAVRKFLKKESSDSTNIKTITRTATETTDSKPDSRKKAPSSTTTSNSVQKMKNRLQEQKDAAEKGRFKHDKSGKK
jgi:hypothetical protein